MPFTLWGFMEKGNTDYMPHAICVQGMLMGIWTTKHNAMKVAEFMYPGRGYEIHLAQKGHYEILLSMHSY